MDSKLVLCFSTGGSLFSRLIRWATWGRYSHVDFVTQDNTLLGARLFGGVRVRPLSDLKAGNFEMLEVRCSPDQAKAILYSAMAKVGQNYDWLGIIAYPFRLNWQHRSKVFCSEYIAHHCRKSGVILQARAEDHTLSPRDLRMSPLLKELT